MDIVGTSLFITKGDSEEFTVWQEIDGVKKPLVDGDTLYFTIKKSTTTAEITLQKIVTNFIDGSAVIRLTHEETKLLTVGKYVYDIQVKNGSAVKTIIKPSSLTILPEVTYD